MEIVNSEDYETCKKFVDATGSLEEAVDLYYQSNDGNGQGFV